MNENHYPTIKDIYDIVNRLEDKVDERMARIDKRVDSLEQLRDKIVGSWLVLSFIVVGASSFFWDWVKSKL